MKLTRISQATGIKRTRELNVTQDQLDRYERGELIQNVTPQLTDDEREFIMTGITSEEWDDLYKEENITPEERHYIETGFGEYDDDQPF